MRNGHLGLGSLGAQTATKQKWSLAQSESFEHPLAIGGILGPQPPSMQLSSDLHYESEVHTYPVFSSSVGGRGSRGS
jgi:hypothetical protein